MGAGADAGRRGRAGAVGYVHAPSDPAPDVPARADSHGHATADYPAGPNIDTTPYCDWRDADAAEDARAWHLSGPVRVSGDRKSTRLNSSHIQKSRMPSSA